MYILHAGGIVLKLSLLGSVLFIFAFAYAAESDDPVAPWREGVKVAPAVPVSERHAIHTYFNVNPESPDGKRLLYFTSTARDGQSGEIRMLERATGEEKILVRNLRTEDAHRVACQQWISGGKRVVFHDERNGEWVIACVDVESGEEKILARDRLLCWGRPETDLVPIYGKHWNPGPHRDLEILNVATGEIRKVLTAEKVLAAYPQWAAQNFGAISPTIFFPVLSPDLKRVFFKMAAAGNGDPRSKGASKRLGLLVYDIDGGKMLFKRDQWGHPAWHPDSRQIIETANDVIDTTTGQVARIPGLPNYGSGHPSASPDGKLVVTDTTLERFGGTKNDWGIVVMDLRGGTPATVHSFDNSRGASSWRKTHPHPVFSADGKRIYFNVSTSEWVQLYVAERRP